MRVPQLPERLWWDHNAHYHRWLLRQVPVAARQVLDVGCGTGRLACRLTSPSRHVDAVDQSAVMIAAASRRWAQAENVRWLEGDVFDPGLPLAANGYDVVTAVSSLHHMPLVPALERLATLLRPGGVLVVVGHYRPITLTDYALRVAALPANAVVGVALSAMGRAGKPDDEGMPVLPATTTASEVVAATERALPGARLRRALFWRYLLTWRRP